MKMTRREEKRLTGRELHALFDKLFPHGFASADSASCKSQVTIATAVALTSEAAAMSYCRLTN
jgi:hypothetical protein